MGRFLIRLDGDEGPRYLEWSTIVDAPVTFGMTREELATHYRDEYGRAGSRDFEERMRRVDEKGTSAYDYTVADHISGNRAGPDETELTAEELYQAYGLGRPIRDGWTVPTVPE